MDDDYKIKPFNIILPKTTVYVKVGILELNGSIF